jgi:hypothetical protein
VISGVSPPRQKKFGNTPKRSLTSACSELVVGAGGSGVVMMASLAVNPTASLRRRLTRACLFKPGTPVGVTVEMCVSCLGSVGY